MNINLLLSACYIICALVLTSCGGGSSDSGVDTNVTDDGFTADSEVQTDSGSTDDAIDEGSAVTDADSNSADSDIPTDSGSDDTNSDASSSVEESTEDEGAEGNADVTDNTESSDTTVNNTGDSSSLEAVGLGIRVWRKYQPENEIRRFRLNSKGQLAGIAQEFDSETFETTPRLIVGDDPGTLRVLLTEGASLPEDAASTIVSGFDEDTLGFGNDGTVAVSVQLTGSRPGRALIAAGTGALRTIARTGRILDPINSQPFEVEQIGNVSVGGNGTVLFSVVTNVNRQQILLSDDGESLVAIAHQRENGLEQVPITTNGNCTVIFRDDPIGNSREFLYDYGNAFALPDGSLVFSATLSGDCAWNGSSALVRYRDGVYESLASRGQPVPGMTTTFADGGDVIGVTADNRIIINTRIANDTSVLATKTDTLWEFPPTGNPLLIIAEGETITTPAGQFEAGIFDSIYHNNTVGRYAIRRVFDGEASIFVGSVRNPVAYENFQAQGASSFEYRVGSRDLLPPPYTSDHFFSDVVPAWLLDDGGLVFFGTVQDAANNSLNFTGGLWLADGSGGLTELITPGAEILVENGDPVDFSYIPELSIGTNTFTTDGSGIAELGQAVVEVILKIEVR